MKFLYYSNFKSGKCISGIFLDCTFLGGDNSRQNLALQYKMEIKQPRAKLQGIFKTIE